jgi:hypothetical protein
MTIYRRPTLLVAPLGDSGLSSCGRCCPRCQSALYRVARRLPDLLLSLFMPLRRYRCISLQCSWEGNLRQKRAALASLVLNRRTKCPVSAITNP